MGRNSEAVGQLKSSVKTKLPPIVTIAMGFLGDGCGELLEFLFKKSRVLWH